MCPLFIAFLAGLGFCFFYGIAYGKPYLLLTPFDYDGNGCGYDSGFKDHPYIYWPKITVDYDQIGNLKYSELLNVNTCVKTCPIGDSSDGDTFCKYNSVVTAVKTCIA